LKALVLDRGYRGSIGVVTPFQAQRGAIDAAIRADEVLSRAMPPDFLVDTVHKFQGDERDVMIFSPVLSEDMPKGGLGFLRSNGNLFNVAITRARAQLIVVGDLAACRQSEVGYLSAFAEYSERIVREDRSPVDEAARDCGQDYPSVPNPEQVSEWEHIFYRALYGAGIVAVPQYPVEKYRLDLLVTDGRRRLNIEIDGERYHRNWNGELCRRDQLRNHRLFELGYDVMRFWVYEVRDDLDGCVEKVNQWKAGSKSNDKQNLHNHSGTANS
jgi:very-short-patch-repair endonuclease